MTLFSIWETILSIAVDRDAVSSKFHQLLAKKVRHPFDEGWCTTILKCLRVKSTETALRGAKILAEIPLSSSVHLPYYHSFGMTTEHTIFIESPLRMNVFKFMSAKLRAAPYSSALSWRPNLKVPYSVYKLILEHLSMTGHLF